MGNAVSAMSALRSWFLERVMQWTELVSPVSGDDLHPADCKTQGTGRILQPDRNTYIFRAPLVPDKLSLQLPLAAYESLTTSPSLADRRARP